MPTTGSHCIAGAPVHVLHVDNFLTQLEGIRSGSEDQERASRQQAWQEMAAAVKQEWQVSFAPQQQLRVRLAPPQAVNNQRLRAAPVARWVAPAHRLQGQQRHIERQASTTAVHLVARTASQSRRRHASTGSRLQHGNRTPGLAAVHQAHQPSGQPQQQQQQPQRQQQQQQNGQGPPRFRFIAGRTHPPVPHSTQQLQTATHGRAGRRRTATRNPPPLWQIPVNAFFH